jgi:hypothetical protein
VIRQYVKRAALTDAASLFSTSEAPQVSGSVPSLDPSQYWKNEHASCRGHPRAETPLLGAMEVRAPSRAEPGGLHLNFFDQGVEPCRRRVAGSRIQTATAIPMAAPRTVSTARSPTNDAVLVGWASSVMIRIIGVKNTNASP